MCAKSLNFLVVVLSVLRAADAGFCGNETCVIPLEISCEDLANQYNFQGECCSLTTDPSTEGCHVQTSSNCGWKPKRGSCDEIFQCNTVHVSETTEDCPASDIDVLRPADPSFCGDDMCVIPLDISCENLANQYDFQGECCSLTTDSNTGGCHVQTSSNCVWQPKSGSCDEMFRCNTAYVSETTETCPASEIDVFFRPADPSFCGDDMCFIPLDISCEDLANQYNFQGECCSLTTDPNTGGCHVQTSSSCSWEPKSGSCDDMLRCNTAFVSETTESCPASEIDVFFRDPSFCGDDMCIIPLDISCEDVVNQYNFEGECCSLTTDPSTGGCHVQTSSSCAWEPKRGSCDETFRCNTVYVSETTEACPASEIDAFFRPVDPSFCGDDMCVIPLDISCEDLANQYDFEGECCSLKAIPSTGGCHVQTSSSCAWEPKSGPCNEVFRCNIAYVSETTESCPASEIDVFNDVIAVSGADEATISPISPIMIPTDFPTPNPTTMIAESGAQNGLSVSSTILMVVVSNLFITILS